MHTAMRKGKKMSRYIDADLLKRELSGWDWQDLYLPTHFDELIDEQPTADVQPVVYGEREEVCDTNSQDYNSELRC